MKWCKTPFSIKEMQITPVKKYIALNRMTKIIKSDTINTIKDLKQLQLIRC